MSRQYRKFDADFKHGAVQLVFETGKPIAQVARELGINEGTLGNWCAGERRKRENGNAALSEDERAELVRLRKEVTELRMQRDVLKRSVALWVDEAMGRERWPPSSPPRGSSIGCRRRPPAGRWESARRGSTSGGTAPPRPSTPAGWRWPPRSPGCSPSITVGTGRRGSPPTCTRPAGASARTPSRRSCANSAWSPGPRSAASRPPARAGGGGGRRT